MTVGSLDVMQGSRPIVPQNALGSCGGHRTSGPVSCLRTQVAHGYQSACTIVQRIDANLRVFVYHDEPLRVESGPAVFDWKPRVVVPHVVDLIRGEGGDEQVRHAERLQILNPSVA